MDQRYSPLCRVVFRLKAAWSANETELETIAEPEKLASQLEVVNMLHT